MARKNPFDQEARDLATQMKDASEQLAATAEGVQPFDSEKLSDEEMLLIYQHPISFYPDMEGQITNAEAAQMMLQEMGPVSYVKMVEKMHAMMQKAGG